MPGRLESGSTILALVGPTAVGKTRVAIHIAPPLDAEIISIDSAQVYRGMDKGTAKPRPTESSGTTIHMVDVADPVSDYSVALFKERAVSTMADVISRGRKPFLVGGSGLYFRAIVDDLDFAGGGGCDELRSGLSEIDTVELYRLLRDADPEAADRIPMENRRRVLRALEVAYSGTRLISEMQESWRSFRSPYNLVAAGLSMDRALLYRCIDRRVDEMIRAGLIDEVESLKKSGKLRRGTTAADALGYRQILDHFDGNLGLHEAVEEIKRRTRNYAKRQLTWFRKDPRIKWFHVECGPGTPFEEVKTALGKTGDLILEYMLDKLEN